MIKVSKQRMKKIDKSKYSVSKIIDDLKDKDFFEPIKINTQIYDEYIKRCEDLTINLGYSCDKE